MRSRDGVVDQFESFLRCHADELRAGVRIGVRIGVRKHASAKRVGVARMKLNPDVQWGRSGLRVTRLT